MSKQSGLGDNLYSGGYDLSGDIGQVGTIQGGPAALEVTGINKHAPERIGGRRDGSIGYTAWFNPAIGRAHPVLSALPRTDQVVTYCRGTALGNQAACLVAQQTTYDGNRSDDGALSFTVEALGNGFGLEWGRQLTPGITQHTEAASGTSVDMGTGATAFGLQAYLHVTAFTGTDATITIEESSDDGAADTWAAVTGGAFTQITAAPASERIQTARDQSVERYLRVATSGTFTVLQFAVIVCRNDTEVVF